MNKFLNTHKRVEIEAEGGRVTLTTAYWKFSTLQHIFEYFKAPKYTQNY